MRRCAWPTLRKQPSTSGLEKPPARSATVGEEKAKTATLPDGTTVITSLTNVSKPTLTVCRPEATKNTGVAVLVFPGGGYNDLAWDHEGEQVARWLNSIGVTAAVLKYRVPRREGTPKDKPPIQALMDAQRAISLVRSKAAEWGVDPKRIGVLGFSAGGHLAAWAATNFDKRAYDKVDASDEASCRPDFAVMIYPGGVVKRGTAELSPEIRVTPQTPPCFFAHASDDRVNAREQRGDVPGLEAGGCAGRTAHLRLGRPRLRHAAHRQARRHLAQAVRGVVARYWCCSREHCTLTPRSGRVYRPGLGREGCGRNRCGASLTAAMQSSPATYSRKSAM